MLIQFRELPVQCSGGKYSTVCPGIRDVRGGEAVYPLLPQPWLEDNRAGVNQNYGGRTFPCCAGTAVWLWPSLWLRTSAHMLLCSHTGCSGGEAVGLLMIPCLLCPSTRTAVDADSCAGHEGQYAPLCLWKAVK